MPDQHRPGVMTGRHRFMPQSPRGWVVTGLAALLLAGAVAFGFAYFVLLGGKSPAPLTLSRTPGSPASQPLQAASQLAGTWTVTPDSVAGYRVREKLASLAAPSEGVGRTNAVTGSLTVAATATTLTVPAAKFTVDVSTLTSDRDMRDRRIHSIGLESDTYPQASFELTQPISVPVPIPGATSTQLSATGKLTIHGTTRSVTIPIKAQLTGTELETAGSISFPFSDYGMRPPSIGNFVSVEDNATMEFDLRLRHS